MSNLLLINCRPDQRRVAHIENGLTTELFFERIRAQGLVGNIYMGRVVRVLPGMQCAFVEAGLHRTAFLFVSNASPPTLTYIYYICYNIYIYIYIYIYI